jgi:hypothetical protein
MPPSFQPYTPSEVARLRATRLTDIKQVRAKLVSEMVAMKIRLPEK